MSSSSDKIWYVRKGIKKLGPFSNAEMRGLASSGKLVPEDMIWKDGLDGWVKASKLKGVFPTPVQDVQLNTPEEIPSTLTQTVTDLSNSKTESHDQLILLISLMIGFVFALFGGGLLYSAVKNRSLTTSPAASFSKSSTLKSSKILGVRLGDNISKYKVLKVEKRADEDNAFNRFSVDKYYIDPSTFERPGSMGLYTWDYVAKVDSNNMVYEVDCILHPPTPTMIANQGKPDGPSFDLFPAISTVYPLQLRQEMYNGTQELSVEAKDGYHIIAKTKGFYNWEANVRIFHLDTAIQIDKSLEDRSNKAILKKNEGF